MPPLVPPVRAQNLTGRSRARRRERTLTPPTAATFPPRAVQEGGEGRRAVAGDHLSEDLAGRHVESGDAGDGAVRPVLDRRARRRSRPSRRPRGPSPPSGRIKREGATARYARCSLERRPSSTLDNRAPASMSGSLSSRGAPARPRSGTPGRRGQACPATAERVVQQSVPCLTRHAVRHAGRSDSGVVHDPPSVCGCARRQRPAEAHAPPGRACDTATSSEGDRRIRPR